MTETLQQVINALEYANKKGAFTLQEAHNVFLMTEGVKGYVPPPSLPDALAVLKNHLKEDPEYRKDWENKLAMEFKDEHEISAGAFTISAIADSAAKRFIDNLIV